MSSFAWGKYNGSLSSLFFYGNFFKKFFENFRHPFLSPRSLFEPNGHFFFSFQSIFD